MNRSRTALIPLFLCVALLLLSTGTCLGELEVFATFENSEEVAGITTSDGVKIQVSERFPAWGKNSLEVVFPEGGGELVLSKIPNDWRWQGSLLVFAWSQQPSSVVIRLRDAAASQYEREFGTRPGVNHLQLPLESVGGLDLGQMKEVRIECRQAGILYLDYFALDRFHPVLEERGRWDINYSNKVVTPSVPWGRALSTGPIRTFAIADVANGRGVIELAQRLEMEVQAVTIGRSPGINKWGFGDFYEQRSGGGEFWSDPYSLAHAYIADDLLNGPDFEVILWPGLHPWESYPREVTEEVVKKVEAGAGLVLFYPLSEVERGSDLWELSPLVVGEKRGGEFGTAQAEVDRSKWRSKQEHYITRGVPLEAFPWGHFGVVESHVLGDVLLETSAGTPVLAVKEVGKGRVAAFAYPEKGMIPQIDNVFETGVYYPYHEYLWSLVARAVVWAARHEPQHAIIGAEASEGGITVDLSGPGLEGRLDIAFVNTYGEKEAELLRVLDPGETDVALTIPSSLSGGRHFVDLRLKTGGMASDWMSLVLDLDAKAKVERFGSIPEQISLGEEFSAEVILSSQTSTDAEVTMRLLDNYDRLIDVKKSQVRIEGETRHSVQLSSVGVLSRLARIDCEVVVEGQQSDRKTAEIFVIQPRAWDDYDIVMYRFGPDPIPGIWPAIDAQMRRLNVTTLSSYSLSHSKHANYNIQAQTRISGQESPDGPKRNYYLEMKKNYADTHEKLGLVREYCMNDPAYFDLVRKEIREMAGTWAPLSPLSYYVYEEPSLTCYADDLDLCFSTHCMKAMREWLKDDYGDLETLNRRWGTGFAKWEEVVPDDTYESQARGNFVSWSDHRTFMERTYARFFSFVLDELRKIDPEGILLNSGTQVSGAHNGCDYSLINDYTRHLNAYEGGNQLDFHRSFNPDIKLSSGAGYGVLGKDVFYNFYSNLFKGSNGGAYIFWQYSTLDPDLSMSQSGKDMEEGFGELRGRGIGKLVGLAKSDNHGIAIHYSYPSIHAAWIVDGTIEPEVVYRASSRTLRRFNDNRDGWVKILKDAGLQFDFISYGDIEQGMLHAKGYKALVLPMSLALSDKEIELIREFVAGGGTVISDALPGIMDERSGLRKNRMMTELFGIETGEVSFETITSMQGEPGVMLKGAEAIEREAGKPILLQNRLGKGQAFLLNYFLNDYPEDKLEGRNDPALQKMKKVLSSGGISPKVNLTSADGQPISGCSSYLFETGTTQLYGLVPDKDRGQAEAIRIEIGGDKTIYDVRKSQKVASGSSFQVEIDPGVPELFALVDGEVLEVEVKGPSQGRLGDEFAFEFHVKGVESYRSVATVVVSDPNGRQLSYYGGNRDIENGSGRFSFRTALNDVPGKWKVLITDTVSGQAGEAVISVEKDQRVD